MWQCYGVHITVCLALLVCVLCQPVHSCIERSLHGLDFFLEIFYGDFVIIYMVYSSDISIDHAQSRQLAHVLVVSAALGN